MTVLPPRPGEGRPEEPSGPEPADVAELPTLPPVPGLPVYERPVDGVAGAFTPASLGFVGPPEAPTQYELIGPGRAGTEGTTFEAYLRQGTTTLHVAVKRLHRPPGAGRAWPLDGDWQSWQAALAVLQELHQPHLVQVKSYFLSGPSLPSRDAAPAAGPSGRDAPKDPYVVMEWVEGPTLRDWVRAGPHPLPDVTRIISDLADAVATLNSLSQTQDNPLLHRDIKPDNCLVAPGRGVVLVDFGALRRADGTRDARGLHTPRYTAPEVLLDPGAPREFGSDAYSVAAVAYFALTDDDPSVTVDDATAAAMRATLEQAATSRGLAVARVATLARHVVDVLGSDVPTRNALDLRAWATTLDALVATVTHGRRRVVARVLVPAALVALIAVTGQLLGIWPFSRPSSASPVPTPVAASSWTAFGDGPDAAGFSVTPVTGQPTALRMTAARDFRALRGAYLPGLFCAVDLRFTLDVDMSSGLPNYGIAVAPRGQLSEGQPSGTSVQYEWESPALGPGNADGSYVRPAVLPGGAWEGSDQPVAAPDIRTRRVVRVRAVGATVSVSIDGRQVANFVLNAVECGGVVIRVWGRSVTLSDVVALRT